MVDSDENRLFRTIVTNPGHVLQHSRPRVKSIWYNLRPQAHKFELPLKDTQNFLAHQLYFDIYCVKQS